MVLGQVSAPLLPSQGSGPCSRALAAACLLLHHLPTLGGGTFLFQSSPCSWGWLVLRMFAFSVDGPFSLFFGSNIDLPERRDSIRAQGTVCVGPSVDLIYIMGLTLPSDLTPRPGRGWPSENQLY